MRHCLHLAGLLMFFGPYSVAADHEPGELLVRLRPGADPRSLEKSLDQCGAWPLRSVDRSTYRIGLPAGLSVAKGQALLERNPDLEVCPNYLGRGGELIPNDTHFDDAWHLRQNSDRDIDASDGWELGRGSSEVLVAILDSGIDLGHPEFADRLVDGWDTYNDDEDPNDDHGHGTKVAGLLAANADNALGAAGVDHRCRILPVKVLSFENIGNLSSLIEGLRFAIEAGADVISMSLIDYPENEMLEETLRAAREAGVVLVACAGNRGRGNADKSWPGASPETISVGSTNKDDERLGFSGTGKALDIVAPGISLVTARLGERDDFTTTFSGCSASTPVAAGIASVLKGLSPELTVEEIRGLLLAGSEDQVGPEEDDPPGWDPFYGWGRVNLFRTLSFLGGPPFIRGDIDGSGAIEVVDVIETVRVVMRIGGPERCAEVTDVDNDGILLISDPILLLLFLFARGAPPAPPFPSCAPSPEPEDEPCFGYCLSG